MLVGDCIRCTEAPGVDGQGYCGHCHWAVKAEVENGFHQLHQYLARWARFANWCAVREGGRVMCE